MAYLLRPPGWADLVEAAGEAAVAEESATRGHATRQVDQLRRQVDSLTESLKDTRARQREQVAALKAENSELRHKLGDARGRVRAAEEAATAASTAADEARADATAAAARHEAEVRRLRARVEELERDLAVVRRTERAERDTGTLRARLLLDTLLDTAQGLRRELALPPVEGAPADAVEAHIAEHGTRAASGHGSMASDDPALLEQLLTLPRVHLVVDGYNVTKTAWPELSLERQRDRLLGGLAPLASRSGAEVTVVFDAAETRDRPLVNRPRGVRVLYSREGVIADDVIRELVAAEPTGRPVVVVTSDNAVVADVVAGRGPSLWRGRLDAAAGPRLSRPRKLSAGPGRLCVRHRTHRLPREGPDERAHRLRHLRGARAGLPRLRRHRPARPAARSSGSTRTSSGRSTCWPGPGSCRPCGWWRRSPVRTSRPPDPVCP